MNRFLAFVVALWLGLDTCPAPVDFDGTDDFIDCGTSDTFELLADFSIALWVDGSTWSLGATWRPLVHRMAGNYLATAGEYGYDIGFRVISTTEYVYFALGGAVGGKNHLLETTFTSGWHHIVVTVDGNDSKVWWDGSQLGSTLSTNVGSRSNPGDTLYICANDSAVNKTECRLQDVRIYNRALSSAEIETLYLSRIGEGNPISDGLVLYLPLNDNSGNLASATFVDRSGNGNNGTGSDAGGSGGQCSRETFLTSP